MGSGVEWGVRNEYSYGDLEKLRGHEGDSTNQVMNDVRQAAIKNAGAQVTITGHDKSAKQLVKEDREALQEKLGAAHTAAHSIVAEGEKFGFESVVEGLGEGYELALAAKETVAANVHRMLMGDQLHDAVERDNMLRAAISQLNLPEAFQARAMAPFVEKETEGDGSGAFHMADRLHNDPEWHAKAAILQLHCDQGMLAARDMCDAHSTPDTYLSTHADAARKYKQDPAFKTGFDAIVWAREKGPATYDAVIQDLAARDARYAEQHVAVRA